jgi:calcineurin-like phosphoesterase family protein
MDALLNRQPPTVWEQFKLCPLLFLSRLLYTPPIQSKHQPDKIQIVCISDTHNTHDSQPPVPNGDILIHAGDLTVSGTKHELDNVLSWLESQPHPHKFFIGGNHDTCLAVTPDIHGYISSTYPSLTYLQESSTHVMIRGPRQNTNLPKFGLASLLSPTS